MVRADDVGQRGGKLPDELAPLARVAFTAFRRSPRPLRRLAVRLGSPSFTVGAVCAIVRPDGRALLVRSRHREDWALPGGLLGRRESPPEAVCRELWEELALRVEVDAPAAVLVEPTVRRIDVIFRIDVDDPPELTAHAEVTEVAWMLAAELGPESDIARADLAEIERAGRDGARGGRILG